MLVLLVLVAGIAWTVGATDGEADPVAGSTTSSVPAQAELPSAGVVVVPPGGVAIHDSPAGAVLQTVGAGLVLPYAVVDDEWLEVTTTCDEPAWLRADDVDVSGQADPGVAGPGFDLASAVVVIDPGHGGPWPGAVGPTGLSEKIPNLDIADRVRALLGTGHDIDWSTGEIALGGTYPPVASVFMTRDPDAVENGDFEAKLGYRAAVADAAGADALVSIHNNTVPKGSRSSPGTQVFHSVGAAGSDRLGTLLHQEVHDALAVFDVAWSGLADLGARGYTDAQGGDYFTVLSGGTPAAIVEGMYLSEPEEEALLREPSVRQAYAEGVYRGLVRFLTTNDWGTDPLPTIPWPGASPGSPSADGCVVPSAG